MDALRSLRRKPGLALCAVLLFALGLGASGSIFAAVEATLLRPLPFRNPAELVWIWSTRTDRDRAFFSLPDAVAYRERARTLRFVPFAPWNATLTGTGEPERIQAARATADCFEVLGVGAQTGRLLQAADDDPGAAHVVVISDGFWHRRFAGAPEAVGSELLLDGRRWTVVGVLPAGVRFPGLDAEIVAPLSPATHPRLNDTGTNFLQAFARLRTTLAEARAETAAINEELVREHPADNVKKTRPRLLPLQDELTSSQRGPLWMLLGSVALLLLIGCFNVGNLLLAFAARRSNDLAVRLALGATRARLARSIFAEAAILAALGGAVGLLLVAWGTDALLTLAPAGLVVGSALSARTVAFMAIASLLAAVGTGLPAVAVVRGVRPLGSLSGDRLSASRAAVRARALAVASEVALSVVLLIGAGLLLRSFSRLLQVDPGYSAEGTGSVRLALAPERYPTPATIDRFARDVAARLPDVGFVNVLPLSGVNVRTDFVVADRPPLSATEMPAAQVRYVNEGYFAALRIPLRSGRLFTELDRERVALVDDALARRHFPGEDAVGKHLIVDDSGTRRDLRIVGVVGGVLHDALDQPPAPTLYLPIAQAPQASAAFLAPRLFAVARGSAAAEIGRAIHAVDREVAVSDPGILARQLTSALAPRRFLLRLLVGFGLSALLLTAVGIFAVVSANVALRRREIGIRRALGAQGREVFRLILTQALRLCGVGAAIGLGASLGATRLLRGLLYGVGIADPIVYAGCAALMLTVAMIAAWHPAHAAAAVDPMTALRD